MRTRAMLLLRLTGILLMAVLIAACGNSSVSDFVTGDSLPEDLTGTGQVEIRLGRTREQTTTRDIRRMRFRAFNGQNHLVYGPLEMQTSDTVNLRQLPFFARSLTIEYLAGPDAIVIGESEISLVLNQGAFAAISDPPFDQVPPGKLRINPRAIALRPGEAVDMRCLEETRDSDIDQTQKVIWTSSDPSRLRVSNAVGRRGRVTPVGEFRSGDVQITARVGAAQVVAAHSVQDKGMVSGIHFEGKTKADLFGPVGAGASIACLDLDGDGTDEIVTASGSQVRGVALGGDERFRMEPWVVAAGTNLSVASADLDGDGQVDLIVGGVVAQGSPRIRGYDGATLGRPQPKVMFTISDLSPNYSGGLNLAAGVGSSGGPLLAVGAGPGRSPEISVYGLFKGPEGTMLTRLSERRLVFAAQERGGVRVALGDLDFDGGLDLVTAPGPTLAEAAVVASTIGGQEIWRTPLETGLANNGVSLATGQLYGGPEDDVVARVSYSEPDDKDQSVMLDGPTGTTVFTFESFGKGPVSLATGNVGLADQRKATALVRLTTAKMARLELNPAAINLSSQTPTVQLTATARYSDGQTLDASDLVALSLAPNSGDSVRLEGSGLVTALNQGTATIRASYRAEVGESVIKVSEPPVPDAISIVPVDGSGREGTEVQFRALASLDSGEIIDLTDRVVWTSENEGVVRFNPEQRGLGQVRAQGEALVAVNDKLSGVISKMVFHGVAASPPDGLEIEPDVVKLTGVSQTRTLAVRAKYPDGLAVPITDGVSWASSNPDVKVNSAGKVSVTPEARESGTATITATVPSLGQSATARVDLVLPPLELQALYVSPSHPVLEPDQALPLAIEGRYGEGSSSLIQAVTSGLTFTSSNPSILTVSASGVLRAGTMAGTAQLTVTHESGVQTVEMAEVKLPLPLLKSITVTLNPLAVADGEAAQARAVGNYETGPPKDLTSSVVWSSSSPTVAIVSSSGAIETLSEGEVGVKALDLASGKTAQALLKVNPPRLLSITLTPGSITTKVGTSVSFVAEGTYSDGEVKAVNPAWLSLSPGIFAFTDTASGTGRGIAAGLANIAATIGEVSGSASVSVNP